MSVLDLPNQYLLAGAGAALAVAVYTVSVLTSPLSKLPGPWYSKWTSVVLTYHWLSGTRPTYVHKLHETYGPVVRLSPSLADFTDIQAVKTIYAIKDGYRKDPWYMRMMPDGMENVFSTSDVDFHRRHRRLLGNTMSETSLRSHLPAITSRMDFAMSRMKEEMMKDGAVDIWKWWLFTTTDVIGELTFGESFKTLEQGKKSGYTHDLEMLAPLDAIRSTWPTLARYLAKSPIPAIREATAAGERLIVYAEQSIARYENLLASDPTRAALTVFTKVFQAKEDDKLTTREIRDEASVYIVAGSDTTANTLTYAVWAICRHPTVKAKLLAELSRLPEDLTDEHLRDLPYLALIIEETVRLHPVVPTGLPRAVPPGGANLAGYWFPGGSTVCCQSYSMHRDPVAFPDPETFLPERWEKPTREMKDFMMGFGRGTRVCLGIHLAYMELRLGIAKFFRAFPDAVMSSKDGMSDDDMKSLMYFLITPKGQRCLIEG